MCVLDEQHLTQLMPPPRLHFLVHLPQSTAHKSSNMGAADET